VAPVIVPPDTDEPYAVVNPYWNFTVVEKLFGLTVALRVAPVVVMFVAESVVAVGGVHADVVNVASDPFVVPSEFVAFTLK
jgi:hypothetical protein